MLTKNNEVRLGFFKGLRQLEYLPVELTDDLLNDSMYWFAPEVLRSMEFTSMTDVWAFGSTIWEMFTRGQTPFAKYRKWEGTLHGYYHQ